MPTFWYKAIDANGKTLKDIAVASSELDLETKLKAKDLELMDCGIAGQSRSLFSKVTNKDLVVFCIHLEQLEKAGVPILEAIDDIRESSDNQAMRNTAANLHEDLRNGELLSSSMRKFSKIFDDVFIGLIRAGEKTGNLHSIFGHLAEHLKWVESIRSKIKKATYYPAFLLVLIIAVVGLMMVYVIPKLSDFLISQNFELPSYTLALIKTSEFFQANWHIVILVPITTIIAIIISKNLSYNVAYFFDRLSLMLPVIGGIIRKIEMSRFCRFFSITFKSGIGVLECMEIAGGVINNKVIRKSIENAISKVSEGTSLSKALTDTNQFPPLVLRMIKVGESSGSLDRTLNNVNFFYDEEVNNSINGLIALIQPSLTIILGAIMMWVSVAVFGPLYGSFSQLNL